MFSRLILALALGVGGTAWAQNTSPTTLQQSLQAAYTANPTIQAAQQTARAQSLQASSQWGNLLPELEATASWGGTTYDANGQTDTIHPRSNALTLTQPIFTGGENLYAARSAAATARAAKADADTTTQSILLQTVQAFTGVLQAQAQVSATTSLITSLERQTAAEDARLNAGEGTRTNLALATARLKQAQGQNALAQATLTSQQQTLARLTGQTAPPQNLLWPMLPSPTLEVAAQPHPQQIADEARVAAAKASRQSTRGTLLPDLTATATAAHNEDTSLARTSGTQYSYQLQLSVPLFNGFSDFNQTRASAASEQSARSTLANTRAELEAQRSTLLANLQAAYANVQAAQSALEAQQVYTNGITKAQEYGEASLLDTLDAQQALAQAYATLAEAKATYLSTYYQTLAAHGHLTHPKKAAPKGGGSSSPPVL